MSDNRTYLDNQALAPGDRKHVDAVSGNDDARLAGRRERAEAFAKTLDVSDQVGAYVEPTSVTHGVEGVGVTETPGSAGKAAVSRSGKAAAKSDA